MKAPRAPAARPVTDADAKAGEQGGFGFRWFVPELLRHKAIWRDVLIASLELFLADVNLSPLPGRHEAFAVKRLE